MKSIITGPGVVFQLPVYKCKKIYCHYFVSNHEIRTVNALFINRHNNFEQISNELLLTLPTSDAGDTNIRKDVQNRGQNLRYA